MVVLRLQPNAIPTVYLPSSKGVGENGSPAQPASTADRCKSYSTAIFFERKGESENGNPSRISAPGKNLDCGSGSVPTVHKNTSRLSASCALITNDGMTSQLRDKTLRVVAYSGGEVAVAARTRAAMQQRQSTPVYTWSFAEVVAQPPKVTSLKFELWQGSIVQQAAPPARYQRTVVIANSFRAQIRPVVLTRLRNPKFTRMLFLALPGASSGKFTTEY
ncbi:hypothetical protein Plhal304r1_c031g0101571 [Plasmopara halstedii]